MPDPLVATSEVHGPFSASQTFTRQTLAPPTGIDVVYDVAAVTLSVSFQPVSGAASYGFSVKDASGLEKLVGSGAASPVAVDAHVLAVDTAYSVTVRALAAGISGTWSGAVSLTPKALTAPTISSVTNDATSIHVAFSTVVGANLYTVEVLTSAGAPVTPVLTASGVTSPISLPATALTSGQTYQVRVRADIMTPLPTS